MSTGVTTSPRLRIPSIEWAVISVAASIAAVLALAVFVVGADKLLADLGRMTPAMLVLCLAAMLWQVGCRFLRWLVYIRCLGLPVSPRRELLYYLAGFGVALTPARLGETLRLWFLRQRFRVPYRRLVGLYAADRLSDATAYLVLFAIGSTAGQQLFPVAWISILAPILLALAVVTPRPGIAVLNAAYAVLGRWRTLFAWLRRAIRNMAVLFRPRVYLTGVAIGTVGWCAAPLILTASLAELGIGFDPLLAAACYAAGALAGGASMMPGGAGVSETVLVVLLVAFDVPLDAAVSATIMTRLTFMWVPIGIGVVSLPVALRRVRGLYAPAEATGRSVVR